jgi:hypothetical protein
MGAVQDERRRLTVDIDETAFTGWDIAARLYGGDKRSLIEVIGLELATLDVAPSALPKHWRAWFAEAERRRVESNSRRGRRSAP